MTFAYGIEIGGDVRFWHFGDMTKYANEGRFQPGSGHSCAGPSRARLWVHGLVKGASAVTLGAHIGLHARILVHGAGPILIS
jgi:hypothetical protein